MSNSTPTVMVAGFTIARTTLTKWLCFTAAFFMLNATAWSQVESCLEDYTLVSSHDLENIAPGDEVTLDFTVTAWNTVNTTWFHGVIVTLGSGWDSFTTSAPATCGPSGEWQWFDGTGVMSAFGQGFYMDRNLDDNPLGGFGDSCPPSEAFSLTLVAGDFVDSDELFVGFNTTGDNETGSWASGADACNSDPEVVFGSVEECTPSLSIECPINAEVNCDSDLSPVVTGLVVVDASDCAGEVVVTFEDAMVSEAGDCPIVLNRTFMVQAGELVELCTQTLTLIDTEGPVFVDFEEVITVQCLEEVPAPGDYQAIDDCSGLAYDGDIFESNTGELIESCDLTTAIGPGDDWSLWLPILNNEGVISTANFVFNADGGTFEQYADGTARLFGTLENEENENEIFSLDLWFENASDWATWSSMGRSYKDDLNCATPEALYEDWTYYTLVDGFSTAVGAGDLAGSELYFNHMPSNYYFGFQIGEGANNKNCDYGLSGWFTYTGFVDGVAVNGHGDVNVNAECEPNNEFDCIHNTEFTYLYRAVDDCGNQTIAEQTIIVNDTTGPEFTDFPEDLTVDCDEYPVEIPVLEATDNCTGDVEITGPFMSEIPGGCANELVLEVAWSAVDICGNQTNMVWTVTVIDEDAPVAPEAPADLALDCAEEVPAAEMLTAVDNCDGDITVAATEEVIAGDCDHDFTIIRTWTFVDACDNTSSVQQTIEVVDTTAPVFTMVPADITYECDETIALVMATADDNCGTASVSHADGAIVPGNCDDAYSFVRTFTAIDECGNSASVDQNIYVEDTTAPVFDAYDYSTAVPCEDVDGFTITATDNCGEVTVEVMDIDTLSGGCLGVIHRLYTATDECGNSVDAEQYITIQDFTAPELFDVPGDMTVECDEVVGAEDGTLFGSGDVFATDNCDGIVELTYSEEIIEGLCENAYTVIRTWVAMDYCENMTTDSQTVTVEDTTNPEFETFPEDMVVECSDDLPAVEMPTAFDNCDADVTIELTEETAAGDCPQAYTLSRIFRAFDNCGNEVMGVQTIEVVDTTAPVFTMVPADITYECDETIALVMATADDNCGTASVSHADGAIVPGNCDDAYSFVRTFTAIDECGNSASVDQNIYVEDTTAPVVDGEAFLTMPCDMISDEIFVTASDNCDAEVTITYFDNLVSGGCNGNVIRTYTATDNCGNSTEFTQVINLIDEVAPEFSAFPADMTVACTDVPEVSTELDAEDNCSEVVEIAYIGEEYIAGACIGDYTLVRTWTATDACDNVATQSQTITVIDDVAPEFTDVPEDATYECDQDVPALNALASDNCGTVTVDFTDVVAAGDCDGEATITRTFVATDDCGNSASTTQTITIIDETAPIFTYVPEGNTFECDEEIDFGLATADDNCSDATITFSDETIEGNCPEAYTIVRTWYATDDCGNMAEASQEINVEDTTAPVIEGDEQLQMPCDDIDQNVFVTVSDNCDADVELSFVDLQVSGGCAGNVLRTYTATDNCGNSSEMIQVINLIDEVAPVLSGVPANQNVECGDAIPAVAEVTATDNCDETLEVIFTEVTEDNGCLYNIIRTWSVVDHCDNMDSATQIISIVDTTAPELEVAENEAIECDEDAPVAAYEVADVCDQDVTVVITEVMVAGDCPNAYSIERTYTATDDCGNITAMMQTIVVEDTSAPDFTSTPANATFECDEEIDYGMAIAADNCGGVSITFADETIEGDCPESYTIIRTWTATDDCGNSETDETEYTVEDTTAPEITAEAQIEMPCDAIDMAIFASATDNCDANVDITFTDLEVSGGCAGNILRTYVATDNCGNSSEFTQVISLIDVVAPVLEGVPADLVVECGDDVPEPAGVSASDNCDDTLEVIFSEAFVQNDCLYSLVRTWSVTDHCDNTTSAQQTITVVDTTAPELAIGDDASISCDQDVPAASYEADDVCDEELDVDITEVMNAGNCIGNYTIVRTYVATDDCGNSSSAIQTITVTDTTAPEFTEVPQGGDFSCDEDVIYGEAAALDNCGTVAIDFSDAIEAGDCPNNYTIVRTWTATDDCGNSASAESFYYIYDETAPTFDSEVEDVNVECAGDVPATPEVTATDNCGEASVSVSTEVMESDDCGNYYSVVTFTATDACGNTAEMSYNITVEDMTAPVLSAMPEDMIIDCEADVPAPADITATDNCDDVSVEYSEVIVGDEPAEGSTSDCLAYTGASPYYDTDWSLWLQQFPGGDEFYTSEEFSFIEYADGSATISGEVWSSTSAGGWLIEVTLTDAMNWTEWMSQDFPTSYKDDFGAAGDNYLDWTYYVIQSGAATLYGLGDYDGDELTLAHAPANYYYAFQLGMGANNTNANYGGGGWFYYSGTFQGEELSGAGDFAFDLDCCPRYEVVRTWTVSDCSGNSVTHSQNISFGDLGEGVVVEEEEEGTNWSDVANEREDKVAYQIFPNPTSEKSVITFNHATDGQTTIEVYDLAGGKVLEVFSASTDAGIPYRADINAGSLATGIYLVRIVHDGQVSTDRLIVSK